MTIRLTCALPGPLGRLLAGAALEISDWRALLLIAQGLATAANERQSVSR